MSTTPLAPAEPHALSLARCAERLSVSVDTLERHIRPHLLTGRIASYKIGARRVIVWASLLAFLDEAHTGALPGYQKGLPQ